MKTRTFLTFACPVVYLFLSAVAAAQSNPTYIPFTPSATKGVLYKPDSGPAARTALPIAHRTSNFLNHVGAIELSRQGFLVLAMNPRSDNNVSAVKWEENALDIRPRAAISLSAATTGA